MAAGKRKGSKAIIWMEIGLFLAAAAAAYFIFMYVDLLNTIDNANIFLSAIKNGKLLTFYEYSVERAANRYSANYSLPVFILFAVWQAPMLLVTKLLGKNYQEWSISLLWSKLLLVLFMIAVAYLVYKIVLLCGQNRERGLLAVYLYFSSMLVTFPVLFCCQLEVIATFFLALGLYYYLKGNMKLFWLAFLLSVPLKGFGLIMALPLILLKEKNLPKVFAIFGSMTGLVLIEKLIYRNSVIYKYALQAQNDDVIKGIMDTAVMMGKAVIAWVVCYLGLLIWVYYRKEMSKREIVFICCFLWNTFMALSYARSYWVYLAGPFMAICMCVNDRFLREGILIETIGSFCYFLKLGAGSSGPSGYAGMINQLLLPHLMEIPTENLRYGTLHGFFVEKDLARFDPLLATIYVAAMLAIVFLTAPAMQKGEKRAFVPDNFIMVMRPVLVAVSIVLYIHSFTATLPPILFDTTGAESAACESDLITDEGTSVIRQPLTPDRDVKPEEITLKFDNPAEFRANLAMLTVQIVDPSDERVIAETAICCCKVPDEKDLKLKLKGEAMEQGHPYEIRLTAREGVDRLKGGTKLYAFLADSEGTGLEKCTFDGKEMSGSLYFILR